MFTKILIANRGEIACRIIRTARHMGIKTIAVYSDADQNALHKAMADEAMHIGAAPSAESYLRSEKIIQVALDMGAQAIHPGYGFLSENPDFVEAVNNAGLVFIGPTAKSIRAMGLKDAAKALMEKAGVPVVPGYHGDRQDAGFLAEEAEKIGYPVLIKARAGGGGKGMRKVDDPKGFAAALEGATRESEASFGDGRVLIEKYITAPRHIEVQVFGDTHGNVVHLYERDCSLQRRHQKVIEEAPAPGMTDEMREAMASAAVKAAKAIDYHGAGTIEFIVDGSNGLQPDRFWFMEMNTRLQVEHPITEEITGVDLVEWQLRVANGEEIPLKQNDIPLNGHSFEARLYAEDVPKGFLPAIGKLEHLRFSNYVRIESGVTQGDEISPYYDPMIAKIISTGKDRAEALQALGEALKDSHIAGTVTNKSFLSALCAHKGFASGEVDTGLIERDLGELTEQDDQSRLALVFAGVFLAMQENDQDQKDPFSHLSGFRLWGQESRIIHIEHKETRYHLSISCDEKNGLTCRDLSTVDRVLWRVDNPGIDRASGHINIIYEGKERAAALATWPCNIAVFLGYETYEFILPDMLESQDNEAANQNSIFAPMPGLVKKLWGKTGQKVSKHDPLVVLEAMKMEHTLYAPRDGVIAEVNIAEGEQIVDGAVLITLEAEG